MKIKNKNKILTGTCVLIKLAKITFKLEMIYIMCNNFKRKINIKL